MAIKPWRWMFSQDSAEGLSEATTAYRTVATQGIAMMRTWPVGEWLATNKAKDKVVTTLRAAVPLNEWLAANVGL